MSSINSKKKDPLNASIAITGLDSTLATQLARALSLGSHAGSVRMYDQPLLKLRHANADIIFCSSDPEQCMPVLEMVKQHRLDAPVIVVSKDAEFEEWLNAMEAGASDYCMAPFDPMQLRWIIASHVDRAQLAA